MKLMLVEITAPDVLKLLPQNEKTIIVILNI